MTDEQLIDRYVADVVALLPRPQRADVARELHGLLGEPSSGGVAERLARFGHPAEVAARYGTPVALIDPVDTRRFLSLALGGVAVIVLGAYLGSRIDPGTDVDSVSVLVFGWLGLLFAWFATAAWRHRRRGTRPAWKPRALPTDRVNRSGRAAAIAFFIAGTAVLVDPAGALRLVTGGHIAQAALDNFAYDEGFRRLRGPIVLVILVTAIALQAVVAVLGRWQPAIRTVDVAHSLLVCAVLTWVVGAGPIRPRRSVRPAR